MPRHEELVAREQAIRRILEDGAEQRLRAIPGVVHVSVGLKVRAGHVTPDHCIRVYVREKVPDDQLSSDERIPGEIAGVATDVNVVRRKIALALDTARYRPVKGGIMISNRIIGRSPSGRSQMGSGTLGCIVTRTLDDSAMLLGNWHVLTANGGTYGDPIYQPPPLRLPAVDPERLPLRPTSDEDIIARITEFAITDKVDACIGRLDVSSCCRCCGLDFRNEINGLSVGGHPPSNGIVGQRAAVSGATVYKVGIATGRTVGRIVDTSTDDLESSRDGRSYTLTGQIEIASTDPAEPFSRIGDSGAVIIDDDGYIIGLLFGRLSDLPPEHRSYANHIADVCSALGITINVASGSTPTAAPARTMRAPLDEETSRRYAAARERVLSHPTGAWLWTLAEQHREEIVELVTGRRPVSVAWHRAYGPAFFAEALHTFRGGGETLPRSRNGITLDAALGRLADALHAHGSATLRSALDAYREPLLNALRGSETLSQALDALQREGIATGHPARRELAGDPVA